ncbi:hypothetical protein BZL29_5160 [Mycobacterium kansasii]|uniref:Uncharacterized protein n=1 Tax=Mycobacterium kansasii TaxID=1768 RepID=A0A1V3X1G1_MYCKA|nr:hypothetical protein BZL29_5160 [Mycobacterium kansasii]
MMVVAVVITLAVSENQGAGDKDRPGDEDDAGNDHHPGRGLVEPGRLFPRRGGGAAVATAGGGTAGAVGRWGCGSGVSLITRILLSPATTAKGYGDTTPD